MNDLQKCILDIFKEVSKICNANGIDYYAIGGTCIGAVRHQGFIPWDDDLDIAIPIENFDKFIEIAKKNLPSYYTIRTSRDVKRTPLLFIKVIDERTTFIEPFEKGHKKTYKGVYIDIMPLAGIPNEGKERNKYLKKLYRFKRLNDVRRNIPGGIKRLIARIVLFPIYFLPYYYFTDKIYKLYKKYPLDRCKFTGYVWSNIFTSKRLIFPEVWFSEKIELPFEDTTISCPLNYDEYLKQQFGDYMQLPPQSEQQSHNGFVDLEKSYRYYQERQ